MVVHALYLVSHFDVSTAISIVLSLSLALFLAFQVLVVDSEKAQYDYDFRTVNLLNAKTPTPTVPAPDVDTPKAGCTPIQKILPSAVTQVATRQGCKCLKSWEQSGVTYRGSCRTSSDCPEAWCKVDPACGITSSGGYQWDWCAYKWDPSNTATHRPSELTVHTTKEQLVKNPTTPPLLFDILVVYVEKEAFRE